MFASCLALLPRLPLFRRAILFFSVVGFLVPGQGTEFPAGLAGYADHVKPFFEEHCFQCHGPEKSKGDITLHSLDGDLLAGLELERWELVLEVLKSGEMPPEDELQPSDERKSAVAKWIDAGLREAIRSASQVAPEPTARRLTNFEYQNTMRDLFGFELNLAEKLPEDPHKPYHFNNTAEFMLLGPDQVDRYLDNAREALASAIVDPGEPQVVRQEWTFDPRGSILAESQPDEVGVYGNRRGTVGNGVVLKRWPERGEYRIRIEAAAILPLGHDQVPLRLVMGSHLRSDAGTGDYEPVGSVLLKNKVDDLQEFEFRGRIENHPIQVGKVTDKGQLPSTRYLYAQNLFDNGRLNDHRRNHLDNDWKFDAPRVVVRSIEFEAPVADTWPPHHHTRILFDSPERESDPEEYVRLVLERFMGRAFRRPPSAQELERFFRLYQMLEPEFGTLEATMRETLSMVLIAPQFLYHTVAGDGVTIADYELASRLSYFLWGSMPDEELLVLAGKGNLKNPAILEKQVQRLLDDERSADFVENFSLQWLSLEKAKAININRDLFPRFLYTVPNGERRGQEVLFRPTIRDYMLQETSGFIAELIRGNRPVLDIVDSDFGWLNEPLAAHYGVDGVKGIGFRRVPLEKEDRLGGLLTHGSILVGNGTGSAPHPIYRAVWLREAILGDKVKPPPAEVPALSDTTGESAETAVSIKDLLRQHRTQEGCNDCHVRLDPWGIPFEEYNAAGQFQPVVPGPGTRIPRFSETVHRDLQGYEEALEKLLTVPVEASARVPHGPEIDGVDELKNYLLRDRAEDIVRNVTERLVTYGIGRELTYRDRYAIEALVKEAQGRDARWRDLVLSVCLSDLFLSPSPSTPDL